MVGYNPFYKSEDEDLEWQMNEMLKEDKLERQKRRKKNRQHQKNDDVIKVGRIYITEYAISPKSMCKVCHEKIAKHSIRIGKEIYMKFQNQDYGEYADWKPIWFHYDCFWGPRYKGHIDDPSKNDLNKFTGIDTLSVDDQKDLHLKVTGQAMDNAKVMEAIENKEIAEENTVFVDSDPLVVAYSLMEKWMANVAKAPEMKNMAQFAGLELKKKSGKGTIKKHDISLLVMKQDLSTVRDFTNKAMTKYLTAEDLKTILSTEKLKVSGNKGLLVSRLIEHLIIKQNTAKEEQAVQVTLQAAESRDAHGSGVSGASGSSGVSGASASSEAGIGSGVQQEDISEHGASTAPQTKSAEELIVSGCIKEYMSSYLRVMDIKDVLDKMSVARKGVTKKVDLMELVLAQDLNKMYDLAFDSAAEFLTVDELGKILKKRKVKISKNSGREEQIETLLNSMLGMPHAAGTGRQLNTSGLSGLSQEFVDVCAI